jgi:hypothetical protein
LKSCYKIVGLPILLNPIGQSIALCPDISDIDLFRYC